jgi:hypothetical protein
MVCIDLPFLLLRPAFYRTIGNDPGNDARTMQHCANRKEILRLRTYNDTFSIVQLAK